MLLVTVISITPIVRLLNSHESPIHCRSLWQMVRACQFFRHAHEVIPGKASILGTNSLHKLNFMNYVADCILINIVCVCKGLMGGPARACPVQKYSQSLCNRNGTAHDCVLLK